jgi:hypothetical protein
MERRKMISKEISQSPGPTKSKWVYSLSILMIVEKVIQHLFVTLAFYFNWADIASTVAVSLTILMILGAIVVVLFALSLWGTIKKQTWAANLVIALSLFDILGEYVAQGRFYITLNVSFIVATLLLILALVYRRRLHLMTFS